MRRFDANIDDESLQNARLNRSSALNPPDVMPGMEEDDTWGSGDEMPSFGSSDSWGDMLAPNRSPQGFGRPPGGFEQSYGMENPMQNQPPMKSQEDKIADAFVVGVTGSVNFVKEFFTSLKDCNSVMGVKFGRNSFFTGLGLIVVGIVSGFFGFKDFVNLMISGCIVAAVGAPVLMFSADNIRKGVNLPEPDEDISEDDDTEFMDTPDFNEPSIEDVPDYELEDDEDEDPIASLFSGIGTPAYEETPVENAVDPKSVLDNLNSNMGMVTRQYLYENILACLENATPKFYETVELPEDSKEFLSFCSMIEKASNGVGPKNNDQYPNVISIKDKLFYTSLELTRVSWLTNAKLPAFVTEIVNMCAYDPITDRMDPAVTGNGVVVGDKIRIKIMKGETALISVKDTYNRIKDIILDTKNKIPVILGIDLQGDIVWEDFYNLTALLISGPPRSGKSWEIKSILSQMMFFTSPKDLHLYLLDPKGLVSDFKDIRTPHVRKFVHDDDKILKMLRWLVTEEADRRKTLMANTGRGYIDYKDLKREHPEIEFPLIYVVVDEVMTLAGRMEKEVKKEFQNLLRTLISQMPNLGVRLFMIPHVIKDDIIAKDVTDLIPCRISVCGDAAHIENTTGATKGSFPYVLAHQGDMAVNLGKGVNFVHGAVVGKGNDSTANTFEFLGNLWAKLMPDTVEGSRMDASILDDFGTVSRPQRPPVPRRTATQGESAVSDKPKMQPPNYTANPRKLQTISPVDMDAVIDDDEDLDPLDMN